MAHRNWDLSCKVYVGNLGENASKHELESSFNKYGPLKNVWVARNPPGFAFIEYEDARDAEDAVSGLDGTRLGGNRIRVEMSSGRPRQFRGGRGGGRDYGRRYGGSDSYSRGRGDRRSRSLSRSRSPKRYRSRSRSESPKRYRSSSRERK